MILRLRQRHRRTFTILTLSLPVAFAFGIAARKPVPTVTLPAELNLPAQQQFTATVWERTDLFVKAPVRIRLLRERSGGGGFGVSLSGATDFLRPDLLVYWFTGAAAIGETIPDDALLLGAFYTETLVFPAGVTPTNGVLVLYSLANQEIFDVSKPFTF
jgi:hypothetical protein